MELLAIVASVFAIGIGVSSIKTRKKFRNEQTQRQQLEQSLEDTKRKLSATSIS